MRGIPMVVAVAGLLVAGACSTTGGPDLVEAGAGPGRALAGAAMVQQAAEATADASTGRFACSASTGDLVSMQVEGSFDRQRNAIHTVSSGEVDAGDLGDELADAMDSEIIVVDGVLYMRNAALQLMQAPTEWVSMSPEGLAGGLGLGRGSGLGLGLGGSDPSEMIDTLREYSGEVNVVGIEEIDGVATTHIRAELTFGGLSQHLPDEAREMMERHGIGDLDVDMPLEVWIGDDGIIRRYSVAAGYQSAEVGSTCDLFDLGQPVTIEAPPASQVTPLDD